MMTLFGPLLAAALMAQFQGGPLQGTVVDDQGKPVADTQVVFHARRHGSMSVEPVEARRRTDAQGPVQADSSSPGRDSHHPCGSGPTVRARESRRHRRAAGPLALI